MAGRALCISAATVLSVVGVGSPAAAHPLDVYVQSSYLSVDSDAVTVELDLTPGVQVAPRVLPDLDLDGDRQISASEKDRFFEEAVSKLVLEVDGDRLDLTLSDGEMPPYATIAAGYGGMKAVAEAPLPERDRGPGSHLLRFLNGNTGRQVSYQVNLFVTTGAPVTLGPPRRDPTQQQVTTDYVVGSPDTRLASGNSDASAASSVDVSSLWVLGAIVVTVGALAAVRVRVAARRRRRLTAS